MEIIDYAGASDDQLRAELIKNCDFLAAHHVVLAGALAARERDYWPAFNGSDGASISARCKDAERAVLAHSTNVIEIRGEINRYSVVVDLLRLLLGSDLRSAQRGTFPPDAGLAT